MSNRCYGCRAAEPHITAKYGGEIVYRCTLHRDSDCCKRKIRTYAELFAAENSGAGEHISQQAKECHTAGQEE